MQCKAKGSSVFFVLLLIVWDQEKGRKGSKAAKKESACEESRAVDWRGDFFAFSRLIKERVSLRPVHCFPASRGLSRHFCLVVRDLC